VRTISGAFPGSYVERVTCGRPNRLRKALMARIERAILSVTDKAGLVDFARRLAAMGVELISTGGTAKLLRESGITVKDISELTGFPEMLDGRVKTLHPKVHGGILHMRSKPEHRTAVSQHGIQAIDMVVVNLYAFEKTAAKPGVEFEDVIENIDIGGPSMVRSAAKNFQDVAIVTSPADYDAIAQEMERGGGSLSLKTKWQLAQKAFATTAAYDSAIASALERIAAPESDGAKFAIAGDAGFPETLRLSFHKAFDLRYGENPHQKAALYSDGSGKGIANGKQLQGKELSYNNINDTDAAYELVAEFDPAIAPACAIIKHANPCGVALGKTLKDAYLAALACDTQSAFGGVLAFNQTLDGATAEEISKIFTEVIIAPDADEDARKILASKKNLRLLVAGGLPDPLAPTLTYRSVAGGFLVQTRDNGRVTRDKLKVVTKRQPTEQEITDMLLAFTIGKHVKSNAIIYVKDGSTAGIGAGQMSRVDSARIAAIKAKDAAKIAGWPEPRTIGSSAASEAFFPFPDGLLAVAEAGATAVIQPGGSVNDPKVIEAADEAGLAMVFTGMRHFRH
jgi:phosphoribosylaminoimidazolecarboxamide formyltransferase / IMP cyclohydrolase